MGGSSPALRDIAFDAPDVAGGRRHKAIAAPFDAAAQAALGPAVDTAQAEIAAAIEKKTPPPPPPCWPRPRASPTALQGRQMEFDFVLGQRGCAAQGLGPLTFAATDGGLQRATRADATPVFGCMALRPTASPMCWDHCRLCTALSTAPGWRMVATGHPPTSDFASKAKQPRFPRRRIGVAVRKLDCFAALAKSNEDLETRDPRRSSGRCRRRRPVGLWPLGRRLRRGLQMRPARREKGRD